MPKSVELALSAAAAESLLENLESLPGMLGVVRQRNASLSPEGDILLIRTTSEGVRSLFGLLQELNLDSEVSIVTSEPTSVVAPRASVRLDAESNEGTWEEMASFLRRETNVGFNNLALMFLAGAVCASGLWSDSLVVVIGSMILAPAFAPFLRVPFGFFTGLRATAVRGLTFCLWGYPLLAAGAATSTVVLRWLDPGSQSLATRSLVHYWSALTAPSLMSSAGASTAGVIMFCGLRSVHTSGVMITMALIPAMAIMGMAVAQGNFSLAVSAGFRWSADAGLVLLTGTVVLGLKYRFMHRRPALG